MPFFDHTRTVRLVKAALFHFPRTFLLWGFEIVAARKARGPQCDEFLLVNCDGREPLHDRLKARIVS
jgi:hypothetical protein